MKNQILNNPTAFCNFLKKSILLISGFILIIFYQNCSQVELYDVKQNPNVSPISQASDQTLVAPNTLKNKLINGVEVPGFEPGGWMYVFVDDQCVVARKDIIQSTSFYFLDPYLKSQYNFLDGVGKFNISLISFKLDKFISKEAFEKALSLDLCATGSYASSIEPASLTIQPLSSTAGSNTSWSLMGLDDGILRSLLTINKSTKVNIGISAPGFNTNINPPLPLSTNALGGFNSDPDGTGTYFASVIAAPKSAKNVQGVADGIAQLTPVAMPENYSKIPLHTLVFSMIKQLVNRGAEVILLPTWIKENNFCNPLIGQALYYAIERGTTVVIPAGSGVGDDPNNKSGEIVGPRDFNLFKRSDTAQVSCWARYFRGVINVGTRTNNLNQVEISNKSNYGPEGVEILAPGIDVPGIDHQSRVQLRTGTEVSAALTVGAVAHIISFYKSKNWYYSPWLIEDTLMNGSLVASNLPESGVTIRKKKILNFMALKNFLNTLNSGSELDARNQYTDNPEVGQSINLSSILPNETPTKLDVFSKNSNIYVRDRNQFQAVFYYISGAVKVVTDQVTWTSSDPVNFPIDSQGIVRPNKIGFFTITARDPSTGLSSTYTTQSIGVDTISGQNSKLVRLELKDSTAEKTIMPTVDGYEMLTPNLGVNVYAIYEDGTKRLVTKDTVYTVLLNNSVIGSNYIKQRPDAISLTWFGQFRGGQTHDLILFYRGFQQILKIHTPPFSFAGWQWGPWTISQKKQIPKISENQIDLYNLGDWLFIQFKIPMCTFAQKLVVCPNTTESATMPSGISFGSRTCSNYPCGIQDSTTLPLSQLSIGVGRGNQVSPGVYKVDQRYRFWGDNSGSNKDSNIIVNVVEVPKFMEFIASLSIGRMDQGLSISGTKQLAPLCSHVYGTIHNINMDLGLNELLRYQTYDTLSEVSLTKAGVPFSNYLASKSQNAIYLPEAENNLEFTLKATDLGISTKFNGPSLLVNDPLDADFNLADQAFLNKNFITPKSLPNLPAEPSMDPSCRSAVRSNGSHSGSGVDKDPFIVCTWSEISTLISSLSTEQKRTTHVALGNNIDLSGVTVPSLDLQSIYDFNGRNYRIKNAVQIDTENDVYIFKNFNRFNNTVFINNQLTGKTSSLLNSGRGESFGHRIYAFDNILIGNVVSGVIFGAMNCKNIYSKNQIRFSMIGYGICDRNGVAIESFSQDDVRYTGLPGDLSSFNGVSYIAVSSGSASTIVGGATIGGVANSYCYKCFSNVSITTTNFNIVGGILITLPAGGTIEVGESKAKILVAGNGTAGGLVGTTAGAELNNFFYKFDSQTAQLRYSSKIYAHINIINSQFSGSISGTGSIGGIIGTDNSETDVYMSNASMTGTVSGAGVKGSLIGKIANKCIPGTVRSVKIRNVSTDPNLPAIGSNYENIAVKTGINF